MKAFLATRSIRSAALVGVFGVAFFASTGAKPEPAKSTPAIPKSALDSKNDSQMKFVEIANLGNGSGGASGVGGLLWNSGFTCVSVETGKAGTTRFVVSSAYGGVTQQSPKLRVVAKDTDGKIHEAKSASMVSGSGAKFSVMTFDCRFELAPEAIAELIVQQATP